MVARSSKLTVFLINSKNLVMLKGRPCETKPKWAMIYKVRSKPSSLVSEPTLNIRMIIETKIIVFKL